MVHLFWKFQCNYFNYGVNKIVYAAILYILVYSFINVGKYPMH